MSMKKTSEELGRLSGISVQNQQNALNVNKEMSASVQLYYENLIKVKNAEGDITGAKEAQDKYDQARAKLAEQNAKTVKAIADSYKSTAGNSQKALVEAAKTATGKKYKGTEQEAYVSQAQSMLANNLGIANSGKKGQMEYVLTMQMNAGNIKPSDMMAMIQTFGKSEKSMDKVMSIITKFGGNKAAETQQILGAFVDKNGNPNTKAQTEFLANVSAAKTSAEADKLINFYGAVSQNQGILDVGVMVNYFQNNPEAAARLEGLLGNIKENEGKLTYDVVTNFLPPTGDVAINKEYFEGLNQAQRTVYTQEIATVISMSDAQIKKSDDFKKWLSEGKPLGGAQYANLSFANQRAKYADAIGQKVTENRVDLAIATPTTTGTTPSTGTKPRDTTLDELLKKLKFVRDASIDAEGKLSYLMKIVSGNGITKFAGVSQQLMAGMKGGFNREFISMLESMDNKTRDIYMRVEKGKVVLTKQGEALKVAFNEKVIGEFQDTQVRAVQDSVAQQAAFVKLKAAGVDTSTALEMVANANLAVAINAKKITSKEINELAKVAVAAKNPVSTLAIELQKVADAARQKMVDVTNQIKILTEAKTKMGLSTEDLKIISEDPVLMKALEKLLNGDGTRKQLGEFENLIRSTINNIKGAKVKVEGDFTALTEGIEVALQNSADKAQAIFDKLSADIQKGLDLRRASIEKDYRNKINTAQTAVDEIQKTIDDGYDPATKLIIPGLQSKVDAAQEAINASNDSYDALVKSIEDRYLKETLDDLGNIVSSGLLAKPQAEVDRLTKSIEDLQNKGGINAKSLTDYGATNANDNLTLAEAEKAIADVQGFIETTYSRPIEMLQQAIAGQQRTLEITYTRSIEEIQKKIEDIQTKIAKEFDKPLSKIQEESTKLSEDLAVMDNAADAINKKYETQENALTKIAEINQDIVEQQKQQLGLADALSKGDISAAAAAVQDIRSTQAAKALGSQQGTLGKAREAELAAIKSSSGMTRDQIAERQYALERSSYQIQQLQKVEQEKILALQEKIYNIENDPARLDILKNIKLQEDKIYELDNLKLAANNAIYAVQAQITTRNTQIATQQSLLAKAEADLKIVQDKRDTELKAAEITHNAAIVKLAENLTLAEDNLKKANDALVIAQAALEDIEDSRAKAMAEVESDEQKFKDMVAAIDLATESTVLFEDQLKAAKTAADNLKTALENLTKAKDAESKAEIKRQQDAAQAEADRKAAEKKAAEEKAAAEAKAAADAKAAALAVAKVSPSVLAAAESGAIGAASIAAQIKAAEATAKNADALSRFRAKEAAEAAAAAAAINAKGRVGRMNGGIIPRYMSYGGMVPKYFAVGGMSRGTDTIPAMLTPGEFVIKKSSVDSYGVNNLSKINSGISPDSSVYNYSLSVNVSGNNLNADDIASTVMQKIKYIDGQRVRGQR
jgi:hypothetical protein